MVVANLEFNPTVRQAIALAKLDVPYDSELLYGGAKGGGKSYFLCRWAFIQCKKIIEHCRIITKPKFPIPVGFLGRKTGIDFNQTTLEVWKKTIPSDLYEIKGKPAEISIDGRVKILTGGLDNTEVVNKFNSAEYHFFGVDQAEETTKDDISVLRGALRGVINGKHLPYKAVWTANPRQCWLKDDFVDNPSKRFQYVPALPTDNPHLPEGYIDTLKEAFRHRPELLRGYLEGDWDCFDGEDQIIKSTWLTAAEMLTLCPVEIRRIISCDPARFGDDETVIYEFENSRITEREIYGQKDLHYTSGKLNKMSLAAGDIPIIVDADGLGAATIDNLIAYGRTVIEFRGAEKPTTKSIEGKKYYNRRAEAWDYVGQQFSDKNIEYRRVDQKLTAQLCTPTYKFRNGKILVEAKADIKKRTGKSPDRADAYVMGVWGLQFVDPVSEYRDGYADERSGSELMMQVL